ncbi:MAG TPA: S8 family peptidase [Anaerolineae bacterium]|nr:S8 family peptidase [Anaerolineae bacterium]
MNKNFAPIRSSVNWGGKTKRVSCLLILALLLSLTLPTLSNSTAVSGSVSRVQPVLLGMAAQQPDQLVNVIVQKTVKDDRVEKAVNILGGEVTWDLHIINAFAAKLPAQAAAQLNKVDGVRWVSLDAAIVSTDCTSDCLTSDFYLKSVYEKAINANKVWFAIPKRQGTGVGVAVVDAGINWQQDLYTKSGQNRVVANVRFNTDYNQTTFDNYGHGSHIAGIVGGNGSASNGKYIGVAPMANIINVKVSNDDGSATTATVVAGLQWVLENRARYNIRVVNLSLNSAVGESYHTDPLDAAVEILWFNGIVVVVSAGNNGTGALYSPANDPFVITVGAVDDKGTTNLADDVVTTYSAYGTTQDGFSKPDLVAPGQNIVSLIGNTNGVIPTQHPGNRVDGTYFRMSGTSMSAPMVSGAVALLLEDEPSLNPDQVKYRLEATANRTWPGYTAVQAGFGYLDVYAALNSTTTQTANTGVPASQLLWTGSTPPPWDSVQWGSVQWGSVQWGSVQWGSVQWGSVQWGSDYWGP